MTKLNDLDLNLLLVFDAILRSGSVTAAADELGLAQPSLSNALTRLREHFNDPLFVRTKGAMLPTPLAQAMAQPVQSALRQLREAVEGRRHFVAAESARCFRICMSEIGQRLILPSLLKHLEVHARGLQVAVVDMFPDATQLALANGEVDLAIGYFANFGADYYAQKLFEETYVALVRRGHPGIRDSGLGVEEYLDAKHIVYVPSAASHQMLDTKLDREFVRLGRRRKVGVRVAHAFGVTDVVASTDLVLTVPSRLGRILAEVFDVQVHPLPLPLAPIDIKQYWHSRYNHDPGLIWLRSQFRELFQANDDRLYSCIDGANARD